MKNLFLFLIFLISFFSLSGKEYKKSFKSANDWNTTLYDWKIDVTTSPGDVTLLKTELIADEMGVTTGNMEEIVIGETWVKKEFFLDDVEADKGVLLIHWNERSTDALKEKDFFLWVVVNNNPIKLYFDMDRMLTGGWIRCDVPVEFLKPGINTVILKNETEHEFIISVETSRIPNRSAKSIDAGKTWDYNHLGKGDFIDGEYLIRLRLARYPSKAEIKSDFIELASLVTENLIKPNIKLKEVNIVLNKETPPGTALTLHVRGGSSPAYHPDTWTHWQEIAQLTPDVLEKWQFFQWRVELQTENHKITPVLKGVEISVQMDVIDKHDKGMKVVLDENQKIIRGYYHYTYQDANEYRLGVLRERYNLDEVVGGCSTEFEQCRTLAFWVRSMWRDGWGKYNNDLHTPWDALITLELAPQHKAAGMCFVYANTFVQTALSVGLQARGVILDHHFISEIWSNEYKKWVTFDIGNSGRALYAAFHERDGMPQNTLETHILVNNGKMNELWVVPVGIHKKVNATEAPGNHLLGPYEIEKRFGIPLRNNYLTSWLPGELEHGFTEYQYDGYLWWKDSTIPKYEEYTYHSSHPRDFYWTLNQAQIFLQAGDQKDDINVIFDTETPNFENFQVRIDGKEWTDSSSEFLWSLHSGDNTIEAKPVNKFQKDGIVSKIIIKKQ